jgi:hypothetical protein
MLGTQGIDCRGIELEVILIDDAMAVMGMKLMMNTMNECGEAVRSARAELR